MRDPAVAADARSTSVAEPARACRARRRPDSCPSAWRDDDRRSPGDVPAPGAVVGQPREGEEEVGEPVEVDQDLAAAPRPRARGAPRSAPRGGRRCGPGGAPRPSAFRRAARRRGAAGSSRRRRPSPARTTPRAPAGARPWRSPSPPSPAPASRAVRRWRRGRAGPPRAARRTARAGAVARATPIAELSSSTSP